MPAERIHVTKENAGIAVASGILLGAGVIFPPAVGLGIAVGAVGVVREERHQRDVQMENLKNYIESSLRGKAPDEIRPTIEELTKRITEGRDLQDRFDAVEELARRIEDS
ncbi:MAG: hypothetical protein QY322_02615 [bacterium]|nr:MAG: hypothetical protein QY322_02615 [bacterium]